MHAAACPVVDKGRLKCFGAGGHLPLLVQRFIRVLIVSYELHRTHGTIPLGAV